MPIKIAHLGMTSIVLSSCYRAQVRQPESEATRDELAKCDNLRIWIPRHIYKYGFILNNIY